MKKTTKNGKQFQEPLVKLREVGCLLNSPSREKVSDEIADIAIFLSYLCHDLEIDANAAVLSKLKKNEAKYPVEKAYCNAKKYDEN